MNRKVLVKIAVFVVGVLLVSCKRNDEVAKADNPQTTENSEKVAKLGERKENPYTVQNMQKAFSSLASKARLSAGADIVRTTHLYVRFLPKDWAQYDTLIADTSLTLYNIPLDYEIINEGGTYHDPSIPADKPTWQYTTVAADFEFNPEIQHEVIAECYIPEYDKELQNIAQRNPSSEGNLVDALVDEAMIVSGNEDQTIAAYNAEKEKARLAWKPSGRIRCIDTRLNQMIGLQGVKVVVRRWVLVKIRETRTNFDGNYVFEDFDRKVSYSCVFDTDEFDIRTGTYGQLKFDGPKSSGSWNLDFWADDLNRFYCDVFRGAYRYHYGEMGGLRRPYIDAKLKYNCYDREENEDANGTFWGLWDPTSLFPDIQMFQSSQGARRTSDQVFSTTIHETAHASHAKLIRSTTNNTLRIVNNRIVESWAVAVQWYITKMEYRERGIWNYGELDYRVPVNNRMPERLESDFQYWQSNNPGGNYTSLFIDIVDNYNQNNQVVSYIVNGSWTGYTINLDDQVTGYTLPFIEQNMLANTYEISHLRDKLKQNKPIGTTDTQIDNLMNNF